MLLVKTDVGEPRLAAPSGPQRCPLPQSSRFTLAQSLRERGRWQLPRGPRPLCHTLPTHSSADMEGPPRDTDASGWTGWISSTPRLMEAQSRPRQGWRDLGLSPPGTGGQVGGAMTGPYLQERLLLCQLFGFLLQSETGRAKMRQRGQHGCLQSDHHGRQLPARCARGFPAGASRTQ